MGFDLTLEDFLKNNGCRSIFLLAKEACKVNKELDVKSIHYLSDKLVHFMDYSEAEGNKVDAQQVADSLVRLMPCIKMETLYKPKKGIFFNKLNYRKYAKNPKKSQVEEDQELLPIVEVMAELTIDEELQMLLYFKTCSVEKDIDVLKIKLNQSVKLREKVIRKRETKFAESFPFYFVAPDLILYDYTIRFNNDEAITKKWPKLMIGILNLLSKADAEECERIGFDDQTTSFLMLLRQFSMKKTFDLHVNQFIVYSNDENGSPENLKDKKNTYPYIIAVGQKKDKISNYYIDIEETLIPVPCDFDFLKAFDMFFKCHKVFNINYHPGIIKLMHFIDYYLVGDKENVEISLTVTMQKTSEKLNVCELLNDDSVSSEAK